MTLASTPTLRPSKSEKSLIGPSPRSRLVSLPRLRLGNHSKYRSVSLKPSPSTSSMKSAKKKLWPYCQPRAFCRVRIKVSWLASRKGVFDMAVLKMQLRRAPLNQGRSRRGRQQEDKDGGAEKVPGGLVHSLLSPCSFLFIAHGLRGRPLSVDSESPLVQNDDPLLEPQ